MSRGHAFAFADAAIAASVLHDDRPAEVVEVDADKGELVSWKKAQQAYALSGSEDGHTYFFALDDARVIDGARGENSARWLHAGAGPTKGTASLPVAT